MPQLSSSLRAVQAREDRVELREYRRITEEALGIVDPTPVDLEKAMKWRNEIMDAVSDVLLSEGRNQKDWYRRLWKAVYNR
jgi:hypothetical protein